MTGEELERAMARVLKAQAKLVASQGETESNIQRLEDIMGVMGEAVLGNTGQIHKLAERVEEIGERLNTFVVVVERYITSHGNGHTPPPQQ